MISIRPRTDAGVEFGTGTYHLYASSRNAAGAGASVEAVVRLGENRELPYSILAWRADMRVDFPESAGRER